MLLPRRPARFGSSGNNPELPYTTPPPTNVIRESAVRSLSSQTLFTFLFLSSFTYFVHSSSLFFVNYYIFPYESVDNLRIQ